MSGISYIGRFAPSPTGPLHAGSLVAALASWLDARAHGGRWLVRIEDIDPPRCPAGADAEILRQLAACGLLPDEPPVWQSACHELYQRALEQLQARALAYPCACTRRDLEAAWALAGLEHERHVERPYPGTCRHGLRDRPARAWRFALAEYLAILQPECLAGGEVHALAAIDSEALGAPSFELSGTLLGWRDRRLGAQRQDLLASVGDFVLRRADGLWAYQLAVVVDDGAQGVTHVVRGEDLADNTPRQLLLQHALGLPAPRYLHTPLVRMGDGEKLSKQHGAPALDLDNPLRALQDAARELGLPEPGYPCADTGQALNFWVQAWRQTYNR